MKARGGSKDEGVTAMSGEGADEGGGGDGEECGEHGEQAGVGDALVCAKADGESAAAGDEAAAGMSDEDADEEADGYGGGTDKRQAEA